MYDKSLILTILKQIDEALERIKSRAGEIVGPEDFTDSPAGMDKMDSKSFSSA